MMAAIINRKQLKYEMKTLLADAQVSPKAMTALYMGIILILNLVVDIFTADVGLPSTFISILASLLSLVLGSGFTLYCMAVRRSERAEFLTLFDGFSFVGKVIALNVIMYAFIWLWSMLFIIPGIVAGYSYAMTPFIMSEHPDMPASEAIRASKELMDGHKGELFWLDLTFIGWSLLSALTLNLGNLWLNPYRNAAYAAFYCDITSRRNSA